MVDVKQAYFMAAYRGNKNTPESFKLNSIPSSKNFKDLSNNLWRESYLWDEGWGHEYGFIRFPEPDFNDLWALLTLSDIRENKLGAAELINQKYPEEMKAQLTLFFKSEPKIKRNMRKRLDLLELGINRSETGGKHYSEIEKDYASWKFLKAEYERLKSL